jgi:hypothetical protein
MRNTKARFKTLRRAQIAAALEMRPPGLFQDRAGGVDEKMRRPGWQHMRREHPGGSICADLLLLLDPDDSPDGIEIISGDAHEARVGWR